MNSLLTGLDKSERPRRRELRGQWMGLIKIVDRGRGQIVGC